MGSPTKNTGRGSKNTKSEIDKSLNDAQQMVADSHRGNYEVSSRSIIQPSPPIQSRPLFSKHVEALVNVLFMGRIDHAYPLSICCWASDLKMWTTDGNQVPVDKEFFIVDGQTKLVDKILKNRDKIVWTVFIGSHRLAATHFNLHKTNNKMIKLMKWPCNIHIYVDQSYNGCTLDEWFYSLFLIGSLNNLTQKLARPITAGDIILQVRTMLDQYKSTHNNKEPDCWKKFKLKNICAFGYDIYTADPLLQIARYPENVWVLVSRMLSGDVVKTGDINKDYKAPEKIGQLKWLAGLTDNDRCYLLNKVIDDGVSLKEITCLSKDFKIKYQIRESTFSTAITFINEAGKQEAEQIADYTDLVHYYPLFGDNWVNRWFSTFKDKNIGGKGSKKDGTRQLPESFINSIKVELMIGNEVFH